MVMTVGHDLLEIKDQEGQAKGGGADTGQDLPLKAQVDRSEKLLRCGENADTIVQHQGKEEKLQEIADNGKNLQNNGGKAMIDERKPDMASVVFRDTGTEQTDPRQQEQRKLFLLPPAHTLQIQLAIS